MAGKNVGTPIYAKGIQEHFARWLTDEEARVLETALGRALEAGVAPEK